MSTTTRWLLAITAASVIVAPALRAQDDFELHAAEEHLAAALEHLRTGGGSARGATYDGHRERALHLTEQALEQVPAALGSGATPQSGLEQKHERREADLEERRQQREQRLEQKQEERDERMDER